MEVYHDGELADLPENHRFAIPDGAHWTDIRKVTTNTGATILGAMRAIESANPDTLPGVFGDGDWGNKSLLPDATLNDLVEHFSIKTLSVANLPEDELGQGYEFLIKKFADDSGHTAQEFYTNRTLVHLMTMMLKPEPGESVYDPTCGTGGMLISTAAELDRREGSRCCGVLARRRRQLGHAPPCRRLPPRSDRMSNDAAPRVFNLEPRRQWWGVYSVRAHMNPRALAREVLLYDRLVLPTPEDEDEADRWDHRGWDTYELDYIAGHLGEDLVHLVPWNARMRELWKDHMTLLAASGKTSEGAAYGATPLVMVDFVWDDVLAHTRPVAQDRILPPVAPRIVAAYLSRDEAVADYGFIKAPFKGRQPDDRQAGLLLTRSVEVPAGDDDEDVFLRAVNVARDPDFAAARRALYGYEDRLVGEDRSDEDVKAALERLLRDYNTAVRDHSGKTRRQWVSRLISGGGGALSNSVFAGSGTAANFLIRLGFARFPSFVPGPDPSCSHPGAALARVSAAFPDQSPNR